jgi:hypothetical protein
MFKEVKKTIDGIEFGVTPFPAIEALRLQATLSKLIGPSLGAALGSLSKSKGKEVDINGGMLGSSIQFLFEQLTEETFVALIKRILKNVTCLYASEEGSSPIIHDFGDKFDERMTIVFQCKLLTMYKVVGFVLEVNYPDFFGVIGTVIGDRFRTISSKSAKTEEKTEPKE